MADEVAAVLDAPVTESAPVAEPASETAPVTQKTEPTDKVDNRKNPDALRKTLKWLRENGGEHSERALELERYLGENKSFKSAFPTVREAREAKQAFDAVGGVAKIAEMQQSVAHMAEVDAMLEAGDPKVLDEIFEVSPKGIAKLVPEILNRLGSADPQAYESAVKPHAVSFMDKQGLTEAIDQMVVAFNGGKPEDAKSILAKIVNWYKGLSQASAAPAKDPEREQFEREREQFTQQKYQGEVQSTFDQVLTHANSILDKYLAADRKRLGLSDESYQLLKEDAWKKLEKLRNADPIFDAAKNSRFDEKRKKVSSDAADFLKGYTDRFAKEAADYAVKARYGHIRTAAAPVKASPTAPPSGARVEIDHDVTRRKAGGRDAAQSLILNGEAFDKTGRKIVKKGSTWQHA